MDDHNQFYFHSYVLKSEEKLTNIVWLKKHIHPSNLVYDHAVLFQIKAKKNL